MPSRFRLCTFGENTLGETILREGDRHGEVNFVDVLDIVIKGALGGDLRYLSFPNVSIRVFRKCESAISPVKLCLDFALTDLTFIYNICLFTALIPVIFSS